MEEGRRTRRGRSFKERLGFTCGLSFCGSSWGFWPPGQMSVAGEDEGSEHAVPAETREGEQIGNVPDEHGADLACGDGQITQQSTSASAAMNLATALAAERHFRATAGRGTPEWGETDAVEPPPKVSLMRLLEEGDGSSGEEETWSGEARVPAYCCVCMRRKKGAAFIPCGHTLCRICSRELWLNRGSCPLCNRYILDILDLF